MPGFFHKIFQNVKNIFSGRNLLWHLGAIFLTYIFVKSGFDWFCFSHFRIPGLVYFLFPAVILGGLLPILAPLTIFLLGAIRKNRKILNTSFALGQAALLGLLVSDFFKTFTGRVPPPEIFGRGSSAFDASQVFHFGFLQGGVFWGWPSSHTTVAFAMAMALYILYPKNKAIGFAAIIYAFYVGLGVSLTIHWFSDFAAGAIIGSVVGSVVGKSFLERYNTAKKAS